LQVAGRRFCCHYLALISYQTIIWYIDIVHPVGLFLLIVNSRIMLRHSSLQLVPRRLCNIHTMSILNHIAC
jgi:hypothetical protein